MLDLVISGKKPGCFLSFNDYSFDELEEVIHTIRKNKLECVQSQSAWRRKRVGPSSHAIGRRVDCDQIVIEDKLPEIPELKSRIKRLINLIRRKSIAGALVCLDGYPRTDKKFPCVEKKNLERPEVALIEGVLLGYKSCCINYYIQTRYFDEPYNKECERWWRKDKRSAYLGVLCPQCIKMIK